MSGGNKRRRKKCRWNICHLGINVVQSYNSMYKVFFGVNIFPSNKKRRRKNRIDFLKVQKVQKMLLPVTDRNTPTWDNGHVVKFEKYFGVFF